MEEDIMQALSLSSLLSRKTTNAVRELLPASHSLIVLTFSIVNQVFVFCLVRMIGTEHPVIVELALVYGYGTSLLEFLFLPQLVQPVPFLLGYDRLRLDRPLLPLHASAGLGGSAPKSLTTDNRQIAAIALALVKVLLVPVADVFQYYQRTEPLAYHLVCQPSHACVVNDSIISSERKP